MGGSIDSNVSGFGIFRWGWKRQNATTRASSEITAAFGGSESSWTCLIPRRGGSSQFWTLLAVVLRPAAGCVKDGREVAAEAARSSCRKRAALRSCIRSSSSPTSCLSAASFLSRLYKTSTSMTICTFPAMPCFPDPRIQRSLPALLSYSEAGAAWAITAMQATAHK